MILGALSAQANLVKTGLRQHLQATVISGVSIAVAAVFAFLALMFLCVALFFTLERTMTPAAAALWVAAAALGVALVIWLIGSLLGRARRRLARTSMNAATAPLAALGMGAGVPPPPGAGPTAPPPPGGPVVGAAPKPDVHAMMLDHGMAVGAQAHAALAAHPVRLLAVGLGAGLAFGLSPALRRGVRRLFPW